MLTSQDAKQSRLPAVVTFGASTPDADKYTVFEDKEAARKFNAALANTSSDDEWNGLAYAIASREVLVRDWLTPEDNVDWQMQIILDQE